MTKYNEDEITDLLGFGMFVVLMILAVVALGSGCVGVQVGAGGSDPTPSAAPLAGNFTVHYLDVGQGDSELIQHDGYNMLIDLGPEDSTAALYQDLKKYNASHIDLLLITHPHADHTGDIAALREYGISFGAIFTDGLKSDGIAETRTLRMGDTFSLGDQRFYVLWPDTNTYTDKNDNSLVVSTDYGEVGFLFTGDATAKSEAAMLAYGESNLIEDQDVLKVGHHGSKYSSSTDFIAVVSPKISVIEVGDNDYGHPAESTIGRLQEYGTVYTTWDHDITVTTDGKAVTVT